MASSVTAAADTSKGALQEVSSLDRLRAVTRDVRARLAEALAASGDHGLRPGFAPFLERIRDRALPVGRIASELGVRPQAASRTARALEELGYVARVASEVDGRSKLVVLTARGRALLERAHGTFAACERQYGLLIGRAALDRILRDLEVLHFGLGLSPETVPVVHARVPRSIGTSVLVTLHAQDQVRQALSARGHGALRRSHQELLLTVGAGGGRVSDVARALRVSRQAASATVQDLERRGYLRRRPDACDGRAVVVTPTTLGRTALDEMAAATLRVEDAARAALGTERWARLGRDLATLDEAITATSPTVPRGVTEAAPSLDLARLAGWLRSRLGPADASRLGEMLAAADSDAAVPPG